MTIGISSSRRGDIPRSAAVFALSEGALLVVLGLAALCFPAFAGLATSMLLGWIIIASGIAGLAGAFADHGYAHLGWSLLSSLLAIAAGLVIALHPFAGAMFLVLVISVWLVLDGISSLMIARDLRAARRRSWGWLIVSAVVDWLLATVVLFLDPVADLLAIGVIVGADLVVGGAALGAIGWALHRQRRLFDTFHVNLSM